ncbi:MAG: Uma2 family endonuclease [Gammaproteobacteria bacterium]
MSVAMEDWPRRHRITVDEYYRMAEVGLLAPDARVELIEGEIIDMPPIGSRHAAAVDQLVRLLDRAIGERAIVRCQSSVRLGDFSEPQPDLALLAPRTDFYRNAHPTAADTLLVIEVSDTSLRHDLSTRMSFYARHGISELWVIDVEGRRLHVFRSPAGSSYAEISSSKTLGSVPIASLPGLSLDLSSLFSA